MEIYSTLMALTLNSSLHIIHHHVIKNRSETGSFFGLYYKFWGEAGFQC